MSSICLCDNRALSFLLWQPHQLTFQAFVEIKIGLDPVVTDATVFVVVGFDFLTAIACADLHAVRAHKRAEFLVLLAKKQAAQHALCILLGCTNKRAGSPK